MQEYDAILKAAVLGTADYHTTMRQVADDGLRRRVNYVPQRMALENPVLPVHPGYLESVDPIMQVLIGDDQISHCNQSSPYLVLAWLLLGSDNEYRICQYVDDVRILKQVAITHIRIALGNMLLD